MAGQRGRRVAAPLAGLAVLLADAGLPLLSVTQIDDDTRRRAERARRVGLFRYELIREVIDPALSTRARGRL